MKYIATKDTIIMFPDYESHDEMARQCKGIVIGAGFVVGLGGGDIEKIKCVGRSVSLEIKSRLEDTQKLQRIIREY